MRLASMSPVRAGGEALANIAGDFQAAGTLADKN